MKIVLAFLVLLASAFAQSRSHSAGYISADRKIEAMVNYESNPRSNGLTTVLSDDEINAYFAEGGIKWSEGVSDVKISDQPAVINGSAQVDFDKITAKGRSNNPMLSFFTGVHTVRVTAQAAAVKGRASIRVQTVSLDGVEIPRQALEFFVQKYLQPKYPEADLDAVFGMPNRVDTAIVGDRQITFVQR